MREPQIYTTIHNDSRSELNVIFQACALQQTG